MPEPKPVVTLDALDRLSLDGRPVGLAIKGAVLTRRQRLTAAELRAIADWLDQWQDATLLSEVGE